MSPLIWRIFVLISVPGLADLVQFLSKSCKSCVCMLVCPLPLVSQSAVDGLLQGRLLCMYGRPLLSLSSPSAKMPLLRASLNVVQYLTLNK